jgi:hypothetical protein
MEIQEIDDMATGEAVDQIARDASRDEPEDDLLDRLVKLNRTPKNDQGNQEYDREQR